MSKFVNDISAALSEVCEGSDGWQTVGPGRRSAGHRPEDILSRWLSDMLETVAPGGVKVTLQIDEEDVMFRFYGSPEEFRVPFKVDYGAKNWARDEKRLATLVDNALSGLPDEKDRKLISFRVSRPPEAFRLPQPPAHGFVFVLGHAKTLDKYVKVLSHKREVGKGSNEFAYLIQGIEDLMNDVPRLEAQKSSGMQQSIRDLTGVHSKHSDELLDHKRKRKCNLYNGKLPDVLRKRKFSLRRELLKRSHLHVLLHVVVYNDGPCVDIFGGKTELGETALDTAVRKLRAESGIEWIPSNEKASQVRETWRSDISVDDHGRANVVFITEVNEEVLDELYKLTFPRDGDGEVVAHAGCGMIPRE